MNWAEWLGAVSGLLTICFTIWFSVSAARKADRSARDARQEKIAATLAENNNRVAEKLERQGAEVNQHLASMQAQLGVLNEVLSQIGKTIPELWRKVGQHDEKIENIRVEVASIQGSGCEFVRGKRVSNDA